MRAFVVASISVLAASAGAMAQAGTGFTISQGNTFFTQGASPTSGTGSGATGANFRTTGAAGTDHLFQNWWWYRVEGENRETAFFNASGTAAAGNTATTNWNFGTALVPFSASLRYTAISSGPTTGYVVEQMTVTNNGSVPMLLNLFNYTDFDVGATAAGDSATGGVGAMRVFEGANILGFEGVGASNYQVTTFSTLRTTLTNTAADNLNNTGLPFGPGDFTGGFQWRLQLAPGQSLTITERLSVIPAPGATALLGLGGLALARRRRA